jgi:O-succinylbenzoic acid--CoA ligase
MAFDSLTLNDEYFERDTLHQYCSAKLESASTPQWERSIYQFILDWLSPEALIPLKTSGSTGKPKIVQARKTAMVASARLTQQAFNLQEGDKALLCLPADYIAGKMMIVRAFVCNLNLFITEPGATPLDREPDHLFKLVSMVPLQLFNYQNTYSREACLACFRQIDTLLIGGAPLAENTEQFIHSLPCKSFHTYGMTETLTHVAVRKLLPGITTYSTLPGVTVATNPDNCLIIKAPQLGIDALETTDIAQVLSNKEFTLIGRSNNTINTGGVKVQPEAIEGKIEAEFKQYPVLIFPSADEKLGQQVNLAVEARYNKGIEQQINEVLQSMESLNKYERPKKILFTEHFIYTKSGKIQRDRTIQKLTKEL